MSVILKIDEKIQVILGILPEGYSEEEFVDKFIETYPNDYKKANAVFLKEERKTKPGKTHPMQPPRKHIANALKSYLSRKG
jgi:hypothetical protein